MLKSKQFGGVTAMQGHLSSGTQAWDSILSRNVELQLGQDGISTCAVCVAADDDYTGSHLISQSEKERLMHGLSTYRKVLTNPVKTNLMHCGIRAR